MFVKQLSVFMENREGRLDHVIKTLQDNGITIISFSLADTSEYGMLRMIVSEPEEGKKILKENEFSAMLTDVLAVKMDQAFTNFNQLLDAISEADLNIEYMYVLSTLKENPAIIIKVSDPKRAEEIFAKMNIKVYNSIEVKEICTFV